jgi:hypothetical protein
MTNPTPATPASPPPPEADAHSNPAPPARDTVEDLALRVARVEAHLNILPPSDPSDHGSEA